MYGVTHLAAVPRLSVAADAPSSPGIVSAINTLFFYYYICFIVPRQGVMLHSPPSISRGLRDTPALGDVAPDVLAASGARARV